MGMGSDSHAPSLLNTGGHGHRTAQCSTAGNSAPCAGLKLDPFNPDLKLALQAANEAVLRDLAEGKARQTLAIEYPEPHKRISYHP